MRAPVESGLLDGKVPFIRGGTGPREAVVIFGVNALFKRLDRVSAPGRYARQVARILPGYRFIILGYASGSFDEIAGDLASVIPGAPDLLLGISLGGIVALRFAATHPDRVRRLVLLSAAHRFSANGERMLARQRQALAQSSWSALLAENTLLFRRPWYNWLVRLRLWANGGSPGEGVREARAVLDDYHRLFGPDFLANASHARRILCPTLVIGGTGDQLFDRAAFEETARLIPGARLCLFENETHMLPVERSAGIARAIEEFR